MKFGAYFDTVTFKSFQITGFLIKLLLMLLTSRSRSSNIIIQKMRITETVDTAVAMVS